MSIEIAAAVEDEFLVRLNAVRIVEHRGYVTDAFHATAK
jgi:hypothetical protein